MNTSDETTPSSNNAIETTDPTIPATGVSAAADITKTVDIALGVEASRPVGDEYYYAGSQRIGLRSGGTLYYILADHLGGTSVTLNATTGETSTVSTIVPKTVSPSVSS